MKSIVITILACATAVICALLLRVDRQPEQSRHRQAEQPRYQLYGVDEMSAANGKTVKSVYRLDTITGKTWRMSSNPVPIGGQDAHGNPAITWADGWEEMPESPEAAVAKAEEEWRRARGH